MSGVVLRCPSCGTTQAHVGECDACYEAQVRYFCENHSPGVWLDEPQCKTCGARYGEAPKRRVPPSPPPSPGPRARRPTPPRRGGPTEPPRASGERVPDPPEPPGPPDLAEFIRRALGSRAPTRYEEDPWRGAPPPMFPRPRLGGCLGRLILFAFILFAFFVLVPLLMFGSALRIFFGG